MNATNSGTPPGPHAPSVNELQRLSDLCSDREWLQLLGSPAFIAATGESLAATEKVMSSRLGRKISLSEPSVKNPGDEKL